METKCLRILAVDDNPDNLTVLKGVLADTFPGAAVATALNGPAALTQARAEDPDVILLDIVMPEMDGFQVCRKLKDDEHLRNIPVVFLTALRSNGNGETHIKALEAGGDAFLSKPIDAAELTAQIRAMARIKEANGQERREKERLAALVAERTRELERELAERRQAEEQLRLANEELELRKASILDLLEDLKAEIEVHKQSEKALRNSEALYQSLVENIPQCILRKDRAGRFVFCSRNFCQLSGFSSEQLLGKTDADVYPPEPARKYREDDQRVMDTGQSLELVEENVTGQGRRFMQVIKSPVRDAEGQVVGVQSIFWDITERKRAEEGIQRSEAELEAIYDSAPLAICFIDRQYRVERMNRTMVEYLRGQPSLDTPQRPGDILGCVRALDDSRGCGFGPQCQTCPLRLAATTTFETGQPCRHVEAAIPLARGGVRREIQVSASMALMRVQDQPKVLVCLEDITSHKQLQAHFLHVQKMQAIGQLAGGIAHDFNNILAAALIHLQLLQQRENLKPELAASLRELEQGVKRAASLTRQLLLFSRRQVMQTKRLDFNEVIKGLLKMLTRLLGEDIDTVFSPSPEPVCVEADTGMLEQVVMNLCVNARDAMPLGGHLELGVQSLALAAEEVRQRHEARPGLFACLTVTDTGCGMDEATLKRIFEPFFTTKEAGKGTGLGLATVHGIVEQHHGWVEVESAVGRGTTFRVFLPVAEPPAPTQLEADQIKCPGGTETILLVEDDDQVRRMVKMTLHLLGYEVLEASNGLEAIQMWERHGAQVSLLFTDMVMPGRFTGLHLAQWLRLSKPSLKVLISSGYSSDLVQREGALPEGMKFLAKPYDRDSLGRIVREFLDEKGAI
jgi:PAS domain S-box-containing protein